MKTKNNFLLMLILFVICGFVAGILGAITLRQITGDGLTPFFSQELDLNYLNSNRTGLIIREPKKVVVNQDVKTEETLNSISNSLVGVFKKESLELNELEYYSLEKPDFIGLIITSDGWIIASLDKDLKKDFLMESYLVVTADRKIYEIDKINDLSGETEEMIMFHLEAVNNLPVKKIAVRSDLTLGQSLLIIDNKKDVWPTNLSSFKKSAGVLSSDKPQALLALTRGSEAGYKNSFIFNLAGDLVAISQSNGQITPAFYFNNHWQNLGKEVGSGRPFLGINYLDLSAVKLKEININRGALIYANSQGVAVEKNSPAIAAGLKPGDIITWVNNQELNSENDLADIIARFKPGDKITLSVISGEIENQIELKLGELK